MVAGVAGGLAEYFDQDPVVVRLLWVAAAILTGGLAIPAYIVMMLVMPKEGHVSNYQSPAPPGETATPGVPGDPAPGPSAAPPFWYDPDRTHRRQRSAGVVLIALGLIFLAAQSGLFWWINFRYMWPLILIAVGVGILLRQGDGWRR
jgi:phage shock protein C